MLEKAGRAALVSHMKSVDCMNFVYASSNVRSDQPQNRFGGAATKIPYDNACPKQSVERADAAACSLMDVPDDS
eukprot:scaffold25282_cov18-Prasinocladus_malaysianus.AAC.1